MLLKQKMSHNINMKTFYTVTDANTQYSNSRSKRFASEKEAIAEVDNRRHYKPAHEGCYILKAIKYRGPYASPIVTVDLE